MGGADKPLLLHHGKPMVVSVLEVLCLVAGSCLISCNRNESAYSSLGFPLVRDARPFNGPLEGIAAALAACKTPWLMVAPGDCPFVTLEIFKVLANTSKQSDNKAFFAWDGQRTQPLFCLLHTSLTETVGEFIADGPKPVHRLFDVVDATAVDCSLFKDGFRNLNTPV